VIHYAFSIALAILPVASFLLALVVLDSYKLVELRWVLGMIAAGAAVAMACAYINPWLIHELGLSNRTFARYVAPMVEELCKGSVIMLAIWRRRVGFLVDAAISGFAVGAGFAAIENLHYLRVLQDTNLAIWTIRGFGTAIMHGGVTAIFAVITMHLTERLNTRAPHGVLPGLIAAAAIHSFFNHFYLSPAVSTLILLVVFPLLFTVVFRASEAATHDWLGVGFDTDQELLAVIKSGKLGSTRVGQYLDTLRKRFPPAAVVDMLNLIRLQLELSMKAKGILLLKKEGFEVPRDPEIEERFAELAYLEKSIGRTGKLALSPIFSMSRKDLWQFHMLHSQG
jgi:protease PrsW